VDFYPFEPKLLVTGSLDTNVKVWDLRRKDCINTFKGHSKGIKKLAISPDGKWVCSGSENGEIKVHLWPCNHAQCTALNRIAAHLVNSSLHNVAR
jgi:WD40 repeat protein